MSLPSLALGSAAVVVVVVVVAAAVVVWSIFQPGYYTTVLVWVIRGTIQ